MNPAKQSAEWFRSLFRVWRREFYLVFKDPGVLLFFFALPTLYPVVYTLIYNPEIVTDMPVVVVDNCRSADSRDFTRKLGATQPVLIKGYAANLNEARECFNEHEAFAVVSIPSDFSDNLRRGEQATVEFYCNMGLLLRYRAFLEALTDLQITLGQQIRLEKVEAAGLLGEATGASGAPFDSNAVMLGDPTSGFASFVIPGILVLILQQSVILGVTMLAGGSRERRRRNGGIDPLEIAASPGAQILGKAMCYTVIYVPLILYMLQIVPQMFSLPHLGNPWHYLIFITPMLFASVMLGMCLTPFVTERESSLAVVVFSSVLFLFLSGLTWPRYAMNGFWTLLGDMIPATWGVEGFIRMNSNGATLAEQRHPYLMLWGLTAVYFMMAYVINYRHNRRRDALKTATQPD